MTDHAEVLESLYEKIVALTRRGGIRWKPYQDPEGDGYEAHFSQTSLQLVRGPDTPPYLSLLNGEGVRVAYFSSSQSDDFNDRVIYVKRDVSGLLRTVEDRVYQQSETFQSLIDDLSELEKESRLLDLP